MDINSYKKETEADVYHIETVEVTLDGGYSLSQKGSKMTISGVRSIKTDLKTKAIKTSVHGGRYSAKIMEMNVEPKDLTVVIGADGKIDLQTPKPDYAKMTEKEVLDVIRLATGELLNRDFEKKRAERSASQMNDLKRDRYQKGGYPTSAFDVSRISPLTVTDSPESKKAMEDFMTELLKISKIGSSFGPLGF